MLSYTRQLLRAVSGARKRCQKTEAKCPESGWKAHKEPDPKHGSRKPISSLCSTSCRSRAAARSGGAGTSFFLALTPKARSASLDYRRGTAARWSAISFQDEERRDFSSSASRYVTAQTRQRLWKSWFCYFFGFTNNEGFTIGFFPHRGFLRSAQSTLRCPLLFSSKRGADDESLSSEHDSCSARCVPQPCSPGALSGVFVTGDMSHRGRGAGGAQEPMPTSQCQQGAYQHPARRWETVASALGDVVNVRAGVPSTGHTWACWRGARGATGMIQGWNSSAGGQVRELGCSAEKRSSRETLVRPFCS
ncbi:uncharacterized protein LOC135576165 isoform X1 [Columba livia]|uniref:uncharacterized protein LOC135576165 isoform X1 n=1 Tax=Columba livia TaxID=8932 RepID=UPI0031BBCBB1